MSAENPNQFNPDQLGEMPVNGPDFSILGEQVNEGPVRADVAAEAFGMQMPDAPAEAPKEGFVQGIKQNVQEAGGVKAFATDKVETARDTTQNALYDAADISKKSLLTRPVGMSLRYTADNLNHETRHLPAKVAVKAGKMAIRATMRSPLAVAGTVAGHGYNRLSGSKG